MLRFISLFVLSEHCVQDGQQFTHTVNQRHFFGFSGCWQMHVKRLYHRIKPGYHKRCHVRAGLLLPPYAHWRRSASRYVWDNRDVM